MTKHSPARSCIPSQAASGIIGLAIAAAPAIAQPCPVDGTGISDAQLIEALEWLDPGDGARLFAGHWSTPVSTVQAYDGLSWSTVGERSQRVFALAAFDAGDGPALFLGGLAEDGEGKVAWFDGEAWQELDAGGAGGVHDLIVFDDGSGPALYAAGEFDSIGGIVASGIARWDGVAWSALGAGLTHSNGPAVGHAMDIFDDGSGPALYVAGEFASAGGMAMNNIARWDGSAWSPLGEGLAQRSQNLIAFDDGSGPALFTAPAFSDGMQRWDGVRWETVGAGVFSLDVTDLAVHDDGRGAAIYTAGMQLHRPLAPESPDAHGPFRWDGSSWEFLNIFDEAYRIEGRGLAITSDGQGSLYASAKRNWQWVCGAPTLFYGVVRIRCAEDDCVPDLNCDGVLDRSDFAGFVQLMQQRDVPADFNADGLINFFDVSDYLRAFAAGCP